MFSSGTIAAAIAAEGIDHLFAVMGDANQDVIVELCEKYLGSNSFTLIMRVVPSAWRTAICVLPAKSVSRTPTQGPGYTNANNFPGFAPGFIDRPPSTLAGHASLRDPTIRREWSQYRNALAKLTAEATVRVDDANNIDYCIGEAFGSSKDNERPICPEHAAGRPAQHGAR